MQDNYIAVGLELPQLQILEQRELADHFEVVVYNGESLRVFPIFLNQLEKSSFANLQNL